jgi:hypothetical protein
MGFVSDLVGDITGANAAADGAKQASETQAAASEKGIQFQREALDESRRQFGVTQDNLRPFLQSGQNALGSLGDLLGLNGPDKQQAAFAGIQNSPAFNGIVNQGENAILQRASATGGLRGGNVQGALAQYRPQLLNQFLNEQYGRLAGVAQIGAGTGTNLGTLGAQFGQGGQNAASNIANLLSQQGQAIAGGQIAQGNASAAGFNNLLKIGSTVAGFF